MRDYGKIHTSFWTSKTIRALSEDGRTLAAYLLTCEHGSIIGAFRLPAAYACDDLGWDVERFKKGFKTLEEAGFAIYCRETQWVCIVKFMEWNPAENPNQRIAFNKALSAMPETCFAEGLRKGSVTVGKQAVAVGAAVGTGTEPKTPTESSPAMPACPHAEIIALYHEILPSLAVVKSWGDGRQAFLRKRWREDPKRQSLDYWRRFFEHVAKSPFLMGNVPDRDGRAFACDLEWLVRPTNFAKIIEGKYHDRRA